MGVQNQRAPYHSFSPLFDYSDRRRFLDRERCHVVAKVLVTVDVHSLKTEGSSIGGIE